MTNAFELRTSLKVAAGAAYLDGATDRQIDMIVALARGSNNFNVLSGGRLTKGEASRIIDDMIAQGAVADWNKSDEELDAEDEAFRQIEDRRAYLKATKAQKKMEKAARDAQRLEEARASADGRKVRHPKFGEGEVIAENETTVTAIFAGQKKPLKLVKSFVQFI